MNFSEWLEIGLEQGWISEPACSTHDILPMTEEEMVEWDQGFDNCIPVLRLWTI